MGFVHVSKQQEYKVGMRDKSKPTSDKPIFIIPQIRDVCMAPFESFTHLGNLVTTTGTYPGRHIYIDRGSKVLGVAHLDSVQKPEHFWVNEQYIACPTLDNRLGAWILLYGLPSLGIYPDILLTENEEKGVSTGEDFDPGEKSWNWMFSFDRGVIGNNKGMDAVFYQYSLGDLEKAFKAKGMTIGHGSYSCIASMEQLKIEGVNVGNGMENYHGVKAHVDLDVLTHQMMHFAAIYREIEETKFSWERKSYHRTRGKRNTSTSTVNYYNGNGSWEGEGLFANQGYNMRGGIPYDRTHVIKVTKLQHGIEQDYYAVQRLHNDGWDKWLDMAHDPAEWWLDHAIPDGEEVKWASHCYRCDNKFIHSDTKWTTYFGETLCKSCWIEAMEILELMPEHWRDQLSPLPPLLEVHNDIPE